MAQQKLSNTDTHRWSYQQVRIDGGTYTHRQCLICRRDVARFSESGEWRAVHLGGLSFDYLGDEITRRWFRNPALAASYREKKTTRERVESKSADCESAERRE